MTPPAPRALSWRDIEDTSRILAERLKPLGPFSGIVAIARGGLAPALLIAQILDIRSIETIAVRSYTDRQAGPLQMLKPPAAAVGQGQGWLVVDDLADTGGTLKAVRQILPHAHFAGLYAKPLGKPLLDSYVTDIDQNQWLVFPWENL